MTPIWFLLACQFSVIAYGLVSGVFLTFSDFVMRSLAGAKTAAGIEAMQVINREVYRSVFIVLLLGMSALSPLLIGYAYLRLSGPESALIMVGGVLYLAGVFAVSLVFNVPMNKRLDTEDHTSAEAAVYWNDTYLPRWTRWNSVRAVASAGSAACLLVASVWLAQGQ
ncbi:MAG: DUF1772 domain-containing protein [Inquilinus sp.]|nr:DUF1772 domain-containing protein [Inquilinus sp.]